MNPIGLRLHLSPGVLSKLITAGADRFKRFVRISRTEHSGAFYEVDLRILDAYDAKELKAGEDIHPTESVIVTREMVGELFDLLGLFPRTNQDDGEYNKILTEIRQNLRAIWSKSGSPTAPWLRQPLKRIEELLISLEKV